MKYIKWIQVTLKFGICYIAQKVAQMVNNEQIRFPKRNESKQKKAN